MKTTFNFPLYGGSLNEYGSMEEVTASCRELGCDGIEPIWSAEYKDELPPPESVVGYHLGFWADWVDFWKNDEKALIRKFGSVDAYKSLYEVETREGFIRRYEEDMDRAEQLGAEYVVFHVSDVSNEEVFTYSWEHSDEEVIDCACELINLLLEKRKRPYYILVENQWWPGFTFTRPEMTKRLLDGIECERKGIMLDTGHLLNTNTALKTESEAVEYIHRMLDAHGELADSIIGMHLHQSLSGRYVRENTGRLPEKWPEDQLERFAATYSHVLRIDRHLPWTVPEIGGVIERIKPKYVTHELSHGSRAELEAAVRLQAGFLPKNMQTTKKTLCF